MSCGPLAAPASGRLRRAGQEPVGQVDERGRSREIGEERVAALTRIQREEGYMAEWRRRRDGTFELVENHCSIAKAARVCPNLCGGELSLFRTVLGDDVSVERVEHILSGDRCCAYQITGRPGDPALA